MKKFLMAAILSALLLSGCSGREKTPLASGDIPDPGPAVTQNTAAENDVTSEDETTAPAEPEETAPESQIKVSDGNQTEAAESDPAETTGSEDVSVTPLESTVMYSLVTLNVRAEPDTESKIVGQLNPGDETEVVGVTKNGWYQIVFNGSKHFVSAEYLGAEPPIIEEEELDLPDDYYFQSESDYFFVVNKDNLLPDDYSIQTEVVQGSYEMEAVAARHCKEMIEAAEKDGIKLKVLSAYRTIDYQKNLFDRNVKQRMDDYGMSYDEAVYDVSINIAPPGGSEHNAGLAVDIIDMNHWDTYEEFENTPEFDWLISHCTEYGFILRYPKGKEDVTGYIYEPWHYRYVGISNADDVMESSLCLEEYILGV